MLIGVEKRFVFIANSKTASTAIEAALMAHAEIFAHANINRGGAPQRKHIWLRDVLKTYDFLFGQPAYGPETFFKFGVMRDPIEWLYSWFRYRKGNKVETPLPADLSFEAFWAMNDWTRRLADGTPRQQRLQFQAADGRLLADYIIPYADLEAHFGRIAGALGVQAPLRRKNVSLVQTPLPDLAPAFRDELRAFYAEDYALLAELDQINAAGCETLTRTRP